MERRDRLVRHVTDQNGFHSKAIILSKMDCIEWALWEAGDTFFVDADIVFLKPVEQEIDRSMELMLSPHFHVEDKVNQNRTLRSVQCRLTSGQSRWTFLKPGGRFI